MANNIEQKAAYFVSVRSLRVCSDQVQVVDLAVRATRYMSKKIDQFQ